MRKYLIYFRMQHTLNLVNECISSTLAQESATDKLEDKREGRLGNKITRFDTTTHQGLFIVSPDRLSLNSHSNFSTMRANAGVYKGKWMYEVQLGSKGIMQVGWGTSQCKFNQESGVGKFFLPIEQNYLGIRYNYATELVCIDDDEKDNNTISK